jgi:hypothetical protein
MEALIFQNWTVDVWKHTIEMWDGLWENGHDADWEAAEVKALSFSIGYG